MLAKDTALKDLFKTVSITAQIFDQGVPAVDALILLTNGVVQTDLSNVIRMTRSDTAGIYSFQNLIPGSYGLAIFFSGATTPEIFNNLFDNLQSDFVSPALDPNVSITVTVTTTPVIVDSQIVNITITNPGAGYSKNLSPILAYPGGFSAKTVVDNQGSIIAYEILSQGDADNIGETDSAIAIAGGNILIGPREIVYGNINSIPGVTGAQAALFQNLSTKMSLSDEQSISMIRSAEATMDRSKYPPTIVGYTFAGLPGGSGSAIGTTPKWTAKLIQRHFSYRSNINTHRSELWRTVDFNLIDGPILSFYIGSSYSDFSALLAYDQWTFVGPTVIGASDIYRIQTYIAVPTSLAGSLTTPSIFSPGLLNPALSVDINYDVWLEQVYLPYVSKYYGSYSNYLISRIAQAAAYDTLVKPNLGPTPLQEGNSPTESSVINQEVESSLWQGWNDFVVNTFSNPYFVEQQRIYQSVKFKGHQLLDQGIITEAEFNYAKGFVGRTQYVEPFLDGTFELPLSILPSRALTLVGILAWQAKDALSSSDIVDAIFDFYTQSLGAVALKPPQWVNETTFDVIDSTTGTFVQKRYINGEWQTVH